CEWPPAALGIGIGIGIGSMIRRPSYGPGPSRVTPGGHSHGPSGPTGGGMRGIGSSGGGMRGGYGR
ncbi:hypothetical protein CCR97_21740, partial [Rhodoplanes elegans]|nr:hypothetical protein [Rhodoplanes elegans]